jgi:21S rRNA (GM2251-2'-O)-methyltransferase
MSKRNVDPSDGKDFVYGVSPVLAALRAQRREINCLYVQDFRNERSDKASHQQIQQCAKEADLEVITVSKHELNLMTRNKNHQGFVLDAMRMEYQHLDELPEVEGRKAVWLALDQIVDPQNLGAILRTALFMHVDGVVTCSRGSAPLTPSVSKASAGAMEVLPVYSTPNLAQLLQHTKQQGDTWKVVGTSLSSQAVPLSTLELDLNTVVVLGNEGHGLRANIRKQCDQLVKIGIEGGFAEQRQGGSQIDSLNVSVATGILLHQLLG